MSTCDDRLQEYFARSEAIIARAGWLVQGVFPAQGDEGLSFAYTVGLHDKALPELLTFSLPPEVAQALLNDVARHLLMFKSMRAPMPGRVEHDNWPMPFWLLPARHADAAEYATYAMRRSDDAAHVLQVVWPDRGGKFPWEPGALEGTKPLQPVLYDLPDELRA